MKEQELVDDVNELMNDVGTYEEHGENIASDHEADEISLQFGERHGACRRSILTNRSTEDGADSEYDEDDETTGLTRRRRPSEGLRNKTVPHKMMASTTDMTASTDLRSMRRYPSTAFDDYAEQAALHSSGIMLKKRIISLYVQLCELKSFVQLNKTGFRKVLKKFDKILDRKLKQTYMDNIVEPAYPFRPETMALIEEKIAKTEHAYTGIVANGDEALAKKDLRSHLREHVVWERNTVWRDLIGIERRAEAVNLGRTLLGRDSDLAALRLQGDDEHAPSTKEIATPIGRITCPVWLFSSTMMTIVLLIILFLGLLITPILDEPEQQNCLALLVFASLLWATEVRDESASAAS